MREFFAYLWRASASGQIVLIILVISAAVLAMARALNRCEASPLRAEIIQTRKIDQHTFTL